MPAPTVPSIATGNEQFSTDMRAFHAWEAGELWTAVNDFFNGRLISTTTTSASSVLIGIGDKTFTTAASGLGYVTGMPVNVVNTANPANYMTGFVKSYSGTTLIVTVLTIGGSGTLAAWSIALGVNGGSATLGSNTFSGAQNFAQGTDIASAASVNLQTATGNAVNITGTTNITSGFTLSNGSLRFGTFTGSLTITHNATSANLNNNGQNITVNAGDRFIAYAASGVVYININKANGAANVSSSSLQSITVTANGTGGAPVNGLRITVNAGVFDFRSTTLNNGVPVTRTLSTAATLDISAGSTLGSANATLSRKAVLLIDNAGTLELATVNLAGGVNLDETGLISTTAEGGAGAADSATVIYSTTARTNVAYRVVGIFEDTQTIAGTYAAQPSLVQGVGGQAFSAGSGLGFGQTYQVFTVGTTRVLGTTYLNSTNKPVTVYYVAVLTSASFNVNGTSMSLGSTTQGVQISFVVPPMMTYSITNSGGSTSWYELR